MKKVVSEPYRDIDFSGARRGPVIAAEPGKTKLSIRLDNAVIDAVRKVVREEFPAPRSEPRRTRTRTAAA